MAAGTLLLLLHLVILVAVVEAASGSGSLVPGEESLAPLATSILSFDPVDLGSVPSPPEAKHPLLLAANRTRRPDILNKLKRYKGGWNITNEHYWASVVSTGAAAFVLAFLWFLIFGLSFALRCCCKWNFSFKCSGSDRSRQICFAFLLIFTCAAGIGCILLSVGQAKFNDEVANTLSFLVNQSDFTVQFLRNVTEYLSLAKTINVDQVILPSDVQRQIDKLDVNLNNSASILSNKTEENSVKLKRVMYEVRCTLIVVAAVMFFLALIGFLLSIFRHRHAMYIFIFSGWLLVSVTFILCGGFTILNNVILDTCIAMEEWVHNPHAETALSDVLPCVDERTSNMTLHQSKEVTFQLVNVVNTVINNISNSNDLQGKPSFYNQSGPLMPFLCSPYDSQLNDRECGIQEVTFTNASSVWLNYKCLISPSGICTSAGRVTPDLYKQLVAAVNASYALDRYTPPLLSLQDCNFVRDTFNTMAVGYCPHLWLDLRLVNAGLAMISVGVMLCLISWILYANHPQREEVFVELAELKVMKDSLSTC